MPIEIPRGFKPTPDQTIFFLRFKEGEKGHYDLSRALRFVDERRSPDGKLVWALYPEGGGFERLAEPAAVKRDCLLGVPADFKARLHKAWFTLGDEPQRYEGYTDGRRWNGWASPLLTEAGFQACQKDCWKSFAIDEREETEAADLGEGIFIYDPVLDACRAWYIGQSVQSVPIVEHTVGEQKIRLFDCSDLGLCWEQSDCPVDPSRDRWTADGRLNGFEFRCPNHPGQEIFIANGGKDPDLSEEAYEQAETCSFQVRKSGEDTNIFEDGTVGVPKWAHEFHGMGDSIDVQCPQCGESADLWDVLNDRMAEERFEGELAVARRPKE